MNKINNVCSYVHRFFKCNQKIIAKEKNDNEFIKVEDEIMLRGANGEEYEFWLDFGDELKNILTLFKKALTKANDLIMEKVDNPKTTFQIILEKMILEIKVEYL